MLPDPAAATGAAVVVCPGGGYAMLAIAHEGFDVAHWLAERGIAAFVLKYRVMETPEGDDLSVLRAAPDEVGTLSPTSSGGWTSSRRSRSPTAWPHSDSARSSGEWRVDAILAPGAVGFSAGARLVLDLATHDDRDVRPTFTGRSTRSGRAWSVPGDAPPLFVAAAADDPLFDGSVQAHGAWRGPGGRSRPTSSVEAATGSA